MKTLEELKRKKNRDYHKKWLAKPGNRERQREASKLSMRKKRETDPNFREKHNTYMREWYRKKRSDPNFVRLRSIDKVDMEKKREYSQKYRATEKYKQYNIKRRSTDQFKAEARQRHLEWRRAHPEYCDAVNKRTDLRRQKYSIARKSLENLGVTIQTDGEGTLLRRRQGALAKKALKQLGIEI